LIDITQQVTVYESATNTISAPLTFGKYRPCRQQIANCTNARTVDVSQKSARSSYTCVRALVQFAICMKTYMLLVSVSHLDRQDRQAVSHLDRQVLCLRHCNTLQHTATHCNTQCLVCFRISLRKTHLMSQTLQHTATYCNTLQHTMSCLFPYLT